MAVPRVVPLMGNNFTWGATAVPVLHVWPLPTIGYVQVTKALAVALGVPVTVPLTRLLVTITLVPILQLLGAHEAEMPTVPGATPLTDPVPLTAAIEGWVEFQFSVGNVVRTVLVLSVT